MALELLTYQPTGAIVAAPTCSLPERIGGVRNWDYRYNWIRAAAFTLYGLLRIGLTDEAIRFMGWLEQFCSELNPEGTLQTVYGIDGRQRLDEEVLSHLTGYKGSGPVRIGNLAYLQTQLDIYGALLDAVYLFNKYANPISAELWKDLRLSGRLGMRPLAQRRQRYLGSTGTAAAFCILQTDDAACLVMPLVFFMSPSDPMMLDTVKAVARPFNQGGLMSGDGVYRYAPEHTGDGLPGHEGMFNMCTFWLVEALTRAGRADPSRLREARLLFEKMPGLSNHLGLYSEESGACGEALGNFPQAFTHMGLISAAFNLDRALGDDAIV